MTKGTICWSVCVLLLLAASTTDARRTISSKSLRYQTERFAESQARAETDLSNFEQHVNNAQRDGNQFNSEDERAEEQFMNTQAAPSSPGALLEVDPPATPAPVNLTELAIRCPGDCSGNGFCLGTECFCKDGFDGLDCSKRVCTNNCSGNGVCDNGRCKCQEGWYGLICDTAGCPKNCHFNGACHSGSCVCFDGYTGILCEDVVGCSRNCSGNGECKNHRCYCRDGFAGKICEERLCPKNCNGRGECDAKTGKCTCKAGKFHGNDCSLFYCPNDCSGNGACNVTTGRCKCNPGFHGADCSPLNCYLDCSERGKCVPGIGNSSKAVCKCQRGWTGDGCEKEVCPQNCNEREYKGVCTFKGCKCNATWTGPSCTVPRCPYDCTAPDHGVCDTSKMQCNCLHGWSGPACNERTCPSMCSYRGACNNGTCVCRDWWSGADCDIPVCKNNCSRHGECVLPDMSAYNAELTSEAEGGVQKVPAKIKVARARCECDQGWGGVDCGKKLCPRDCLGRGVCNGGVCFCDKGYYGEDCSVKETVDTGSKTVTPEIAARMLCENYCNHGKCFPVPPKANATIFRLNPQGELTTIAQNATVHYECFCEPKWAGPACNQSLIKCPANCLDKKGVCRKDCQFLNKNPCPYFNGRMCGGPGRGKCNGATGECKCKSPFHGPDCSTASCPNNCSGHGMCNTKTMKCLCFGGWTGDNCNTALQD